MDADKEQITEVLIRYATGIDSKDWPLFRSCWADEVDLDYGELGEFTDPDAFTDLFAQVHNPMGNTYHRLSNFVVDVSGDTATARTYVHAVLMVTPDDDAPGSTSSATTTTNWCAAPTDGGSAERVTCTPRMLTGGGRAARAGQQA